MEVARKELTTVRLPSNSVSVLDQSKNKAILIGQLVDHRSAHRSKRRVEVVINDLIDPVLIYS